MNLPLKGRVEIGSGTASLFRLRSATTFLTSERIPDSAASGSAFKPAQARELGAKPDVLVVFL